MYGRYRNYIKTGAAAYVCSVGAVDVVHMHLTFPHSAMQTFRRIDFLNQAQVQHGSCIGKWKCQFKFLFLI